jgi:hypothetical protein
MQYIFIRFTKGLDCEAYQEINDGNLVRYTDLEGNTLELPEVTESYVVDPNPSKPSWGN